MVELTLRLVFSLAVVIGLLMLLARLGSRRFNGSTSAPVRVLHRQSLSRASSVAVVSVGSRVLVLGTTDQQVSLLTELDPSEFEAVDLGTAGLETADLDVLDDLDGVDGIEEFGRIGGDLQLLPPVGPPAGRHAAPRPEESLEAATPASAARATSASTAAAVSAVAAASRTRSPRAAEGGALAGSVLSRQTWRDALAAATGRAS